MNKEFISANTIGRNKDMYLFPHFQFAHATETSAWLAQPHNAVGHHIHDVCTS